MKNFKVHFVIDKNKKNQILKKNFLKFYKNYSLMRSTVIVVLGGDGFMLKTLKKFQHYQKPFYGINTGTFGFLMNRFKGYNIDKNILKAKMVSISPIQMKALTKSGKTYKAIAINEVSLLRQSKQTSSLKIIYGKRVLIKKLISDGVLISTPAGSTAYNLSVNGPILSLNSYKLAITPISPFRPRRWKGKVVSYSSIIKIKNLNIKKRPVSVVADNFEVRNVKTVSIKVSKSVNFNLLYDKNNSLTKKIKLEQLRR